MPDLLIVGAGGLARETLGVVAASNRGGSRWRVVGLVDDNPQLHGKAVGGATVVGGLDAITRFPQAQVVLCTGRPDDPASRWRLAAALDLPPDRYATLVHPAASLADSVSVGQGSIVFPGVAATADVRIGGHVVLMPSVTLTHDDVVESHATCGAGVRLAGRVRVETGAYLGAGALVRQDVAVGAWSLVGMGAVVLGDVPPSEVWVGAPARFLRPNTVPLPGVRAS